MKRSAFLFCLVLGLALALRVYRLATDPPHLYWDEAAIGYNAYAIGQTGKDEWGRDWPVMFRSFGDQKLPGYIYVTAAVVKVLGATDLAVRLPSALAGTGLVAVVFFLVRELGVWDKVVRGKKVALLASFFVAVSGWNLQFSRGGFEANLGLTLLFCGVWLFVRWLSRKNIGGLVLAGASLAGAMYSYHSAVLLAPLAVVTLLVVFWSDWQKVAWQLGLAGLVTVVLLFPLSSEYIFSPLGRTRATAVGFLNMPGDPVTNFQANYVANFSLDYLFFRGDQAGRHSVKKLGQLFLWQFPFVLGGLYLLAKTRSKTSFLFICLLLQGNLPVAFSDVSPHAIRGLGASVPWLVIGAFGAVAFLRRASSWVVSALAMVVIYALLTYLHLYYVHYPKAYAADWQDGNKQAIAYLQTIHSDYGQIFIHESLESVFLLWYLPYSPIKLAESGHNVAVLGKYVYHDLFTAPRKKDPGRKSLIVAPAWMVSEGVAVKKEIRRQNGDVFLKIYEF